MLADDCRGCAGVHMSEWCVHEVREVQAACVVTSQVDLVGVESAGAGGGASWLCVGEPSCEFGHF